MKDGFATIEEILRMGKRAKKNKQAQKKAAIEDAKKLEDASKKFTTGFDEGYAAAAEDYIHEQVNIDTFEAESFFGQRNMQDHFSIGYELGYKTKLSELLIY